MPKQIVDQDVDILNIRLPEDILSWIDSLIESGIYSTRSEVIRDIIRDFVNKEENNE
jgi:putative addiction module CopG family antidote